MLRKAFSFVLVVSIFPSFAHAALLLEVDLTVSDTINITATPGFSSATVSGSSFTGFYLDSFFAAPHPGGFGGAAVFGNLTSANQISNGSPWITTPFFPQGTGLNVFGYTDSITSSFTSGSLAFTGSATWTVSALEYAEALTGGNRVGDIYFPADDDGDLSSATLIGTYRVRTTNNAVIPEPGTMAIWSFLGVAGVLGARRRKKQLSVKE